MPFTFRKRIALVPGLLFLNLSRGEVGRPARARQLPLRRYPVIYPFLAMALTLVAIAAHRLLYRGGAR